MKLQKLILFLMVILASCGAKMQPNQDLLSAYEFIKIGEYDTAQAIASNAPLITVADSAYFNLISGITAICKYDWNYNDTIAIEKNINFFDSDNEKLAWTFLIKGVCTYNYTSWDDAILAMRKAEKLAEKTDCKELKFNVFMRLIQCNINSYHFEFFDELTDKVKPNLVTYFDSAEYCYIKTFKFLEIDKNPDSAKYYAKKSVQHLENKHNKNSAEVFFYYNFAEQFYEEDDSTAEKYILKSFEFDTLRQAYSILGSIYLKRGEKNTANQYFAKSQEGGYWVENEIKINRQLSEYFSNKKDYENAYNYALKTAAGKDSVIKYIQYNNVKDVQTKYTDEIEKLKMKSLMEKRFFLIFLILIVFLATTIFVIIFQKYKLADKSRRIAEAQQTIDSYNKKISDLQQNSSNSNNDEIHFLQQKVKALEAKFSNIYVNGKELYSQILDNKKIGRWTKEDYQNFIDYYQTIDFLFVYSFNTDYIKLSDRQKIFLILQHIGKTKEQIMHIMTLEESSFRSLKSRAESQKMG